MSSAALRAVTRPVPTGLLPAVAVDGKLLRGTRTTSKKTASLITGALNAHYTLILKGNQALALQAAQALLSGTDTEFIDHTDVDEDRGHRRTARRTLQVAPYDDSLIPGARQVLRLCRDTGGLDGIRTSKDIIHRIVSLTTDLTGPHHPNAYAREHWSIENRLHWTRDVTFSRRRFPAQDRYRPTNPGQLPPRRTREHRPRPPRPARPHRHLRRRRHQTSHDQTGHPQTTPGREPAPAPDPPPSPGEGGEWGGL
ncbi:hypothetical protein F8271_31015, partial [Micromonospora sp. ALFpr18c]